VIIDVHAHAQPPDFHEILMASGRYEVVEENGQGTVLRDKGSRFLTLAAHMPDIRERIAAMDELEVDVQILSLSIPQVYFASGQEAIDLARHCNDYLASVVRQHPDRFRALASIPLTADTIDDGVRELARCVEELGMVGFVIGSNINGIAINDQRFDPFYEEANRLGTAMFIHPMVPTGVESMNDFALAPLVGFMMDTTLAVSRLIFSNFFGRFLGIKVIVAHAGGAIPYLSGRLDAGYRVYPECQDITRAPSEAIRDLYVDTVSSHAPAVRCAIDTLGVERILFGSDYPHVMGDASGSIHMLEEMDLGRRQRRGIFGNNAAPLFGIKPNEGVDIPLIGTIGG
jgi:aminocarboxymuconate-semialdehyde decarboxylase